MLPACLSIVMAKKTNANMYRNMKVAYTRRKYMGGVPASRITNFDTGNTSENFPVTVHLICKENCYIRHVALEAARLTANRRISGAAGKEGYHLKVRLYPHHVLRHNKIAQGAGADRVSMGMRKSFGRTVGTAARVNSGQQLITLSTTEEFLIQAKEALRKSSHKLPTPCSIKVNQS